MVDTGQIRDLDQSEVTESLLRFTVKSRANMVLG